jgi:hypothetical protein
MIMRELEIEEDATEPIADGVMRVEEACGVLSEGSMRFRMEKVAEELGLTDTETSTSDWGAANPPTRAATAATAAPMPASTDAAGATSAASAEALGQPVATAANHAAPQQQQQQPPPPPEKGCTGCNDDIDRRDHNKSCCARFEAFKQDGRLETYKRECVNGNGLYSFVRKRLTARDSHEVVWTALRRAHPPREKKLRKKKVAQTEAVLSMDGASLQSGLDNLQQQQRQVNGWV